MRSTSYGEKSHLSAVDRFGVWLSARRIRRAIGDVRARRAADLGCGYGARLARTLLGAAAEVLLVDVSLSPELAALPRFRAIEGKLPDALASVAEASLDVVLLISVLEHLDEPERTLREIRRVLAPGGVALVNVPSWFGKRFLEIAAFRLHLAPAEEMDDHRRYYDPRDLWPLLVGAGFLPHGISCRRHKFAMNTFARCRVDATMVGDAK